MEKCVQQQHIAHSEEEGVQDVFGIWKKNTLKAHFRAKQNEHGLLWI